MVEHPWAMVMASSLSEFRKCLDNTLRRMVGFLWCPAQDCELDSILMDSFQLSRFYDSVIPAPPTSHHPELAPSHSC